MELPALDRLEMNLLLPQWELLDEQLEVVEAKIAERAEADERVKLTRLTQSVGREIGQSLRIAFNGSSPGRRAQRLPQRQSSARWTTRAVMALRST